MANIEAACLGLPLVVSDLPVFRENLKALVEHMSTRTTARISPMQSIN